MIIPNALLITVQSGEEYFFGSFLERELCYNLVKSLVEVSKCLAELGDPNPASPEIDKESPKAQTRISLSSKNLSENEAALTNTVNSLTHLIDALDKDSDANNTATAASVADSTADAAGYASSEAEDFVPASGPMDFDKLFKSNSNIVPLHSQDISFKSTDVWRHYWQKSDGFRYKDILVSHFYCFYLHYFILQGLSYSSGRPRDRCWRMGRDYRATARGFVQAQV
jgi:hypothetical protein